MKILALESSAVACSAALWGEEGLIAQNFQQSGLTHSRTLLPLSLIHIYGGHSLLGK